MNFFISSGIYSFFANLIIGLFVYSRNPKSPVNKLFALFNFTVSGWSLGSYSENIIPSENAALWILRFNYLFAVWLPAVYIHFVYVFSGLRKRYDKIKLRVGYALAIFLSGFVFTPWFIPKLQLIENTHFRISFPGPLYYVFFLFFAAGVTEVLLRTSFRLQDYVGKRRTQILYLTIANAIAICAGFEYFSRVFGIVKGIPPFDDYILVAYFVVVAYAILKHQLMDITVIIRKTLVFAGLFGILMAVVGVVTALTQSYIGQYLGMGQTAQQILSILIVILLFDPTRKSLVNLTDKFLFQKKYDYHKLLKDASRGMSNIESLEHLLWLVVHFITMKMWVKNAAVLMREGSSDQYHLVYQRGFDKKFLTLTLYQNDPLIHYLESHKEAVDIERIKEQVEAASYQRDKSEKAYDYEAIRERMNQLQASCCVPSFLGRELRNILMLGEKKSGEYYSNEDLNLLYTLAQESSIAIENARLYDEAVRKSHELEHINEQLEHSKTLLMKALQEAEGANKQLQDTQAQLIHEQKMATLGRLAASVGHEVNNPLTILSMNVSRVILKYRKNQDMKVTEILDVFDKMGKNIERIKAVVNTLTGLLKKSEKGKFEALSLKLILEETLPLVQFQTYLDNLSGTEVDFNVPGNVPLIRGDLERLQEVFLNLFINAYHAMAGKRHRKIGVQAEIDPKDPNMVAIHFRDNGSGMTEETAKKIFNYGFTTKPPGKGSGLGLYMCKYIIELHGGTIMVTSKLGEGTTFTLTLPIYSETPVLRR